MLKDISFEIPVQSMMHIMTGLVKPEDVKVEKSTSEFHYLAEGVYIIDDLNPEHILEANGIKLKDRYWDPRSEALNNARDDFQKGNIDWDKIDKETKRIAQENEVDENYETYGTCDNHEQILAHMPYLATNDNHHIITLAPVYRADQPEWGGWRWHKWGDYIGDHEIKHEYLYDEEGIDVVYIYHVYIIEGLKGK